VENGSTTNVARGNAGTGTKRITGDLVKEDIAEVDLIYSV